VCGQVVFNYVYYYTTAMTINTSPIQTITDLANLKPTKEALRGFRKKYDLDSELDSAPAKYGKGSDERLLFFRDLAQRLWTDVGDAGGLDILHELFFLSVWPGAVGIDWRRQRIVYRPEGTLQGAFYALLTHSHLAKRCANPDCTDPFFIAERVDERYCSTRCKRVGRLASKRDWMREARRKG